jgi:hypothetical protein
MKEAVDTVFRKLEAGELPPTRAPLQSGWDARLPTGLVVTRSQLQDAAREIVAVGRPAVPALLVWAEHPNHALRYVATFALGEITQVKPDLAHFDAADAHGDRARAIAAWKTWYERP